MDARGITRTLGGKWQRRFGLCRCPAHADRTPSLKVTDDPRKSDGIDVHCFAGCRWEDVKGKLIRRGLLPQFAPGSVQPSITAQKIKIAATEDCAKKGELAQKIWTVSTPLPGTPGEKYLTETRGLDLHPFGDLSHALRWHEGFDAIVGLMTDPLGNEPCGIHRTFLNPDGSKRERKMLGRQGVIRLSPDDEVTLGLGIAEGIEDGLAVLLSGWAPIWTATSAGTIERFPVLPGIEHLTIFADDDETGMKAAKSCLQRWIAAGTEADIAIPKSLAP